MYSLSRSVQSLLLSCVVDFGHSRTSLHDFPNVANSVHQSRISGWNARERRDVGLCASREKDRCRGKVRGRLDSASCLRACTTLTLLNLSSSGVAISLSKYHLDKPLRRLFLIFEAQLQLDIHPSRQSLRIRLGIGRCAHGRRRCRRHARR